MLSKGIPAKRECLASPQAFMGDCFMAPLIDLGNGSFVPVIARNPG